MKLLSLLLVLISYSAIADQTCLTSTYEFRITKHFIEANGGEVEVRIPYSDVRSVTLNNSRNNFEILIQSLSDSDSTDVILTKAETSRIERFSLTLADGSEEFIGKMMYVKGFDKSGLLIVRFMIVDQSKFRCQ
jgi:hypothetical protein